MFWSKSKPGFRKTYWEKLKLGFSKCDFGHPAEGNWAG